MQVEAGMRGQPGPDRGGLVGGVVVADQVQVQLGRGVRVDGLEEPQELLVAVPALVLADHLAGGDVQRGEQARGAVADVVVGLPAGHARHHRQHRRAAVQGLHLGLLVHREDHRLVRRIEVKPDHVADLLDELRVLGQLPGVDQVRLEPERPPDPRDRGLVQPGRRRHRPGRPVRVWSVGASSRVLTITASTCSSVIFRGRAGTRLVRQALQPIAHEPGPPLVHRLRPDTRTTRHVLVGRALRARQHDPRPQRQSLRRLRPPRP